MRAFKKFNIDVGQNFSERRLCSRVWKNGKMTEVNVAQEVLAAGQKRARDFAALLGIEHPVLNAPMPVEAGVELVAAVSEAGGLGVLSAAGRTPDELSKTVAAIRARTNKPFAIHLEMPANSLNSQELDAAKMLAEGLAPLFESLGLPNPSSAKGAEIYDFSGERRRAHFEAVFERVLELNPAAVVATFGGLREPEADALRVVLVDEVRQQQQRENDEEDDRRQGVHFRRDGLFRHVVDADRKRLEAAALREVADDEVIEREREGHDHAGDDAGQDLRHFHAEKRTHRRAAEIHRGLGQRAVHLLQLRQHLHDDIRQAERDVRREHRPEAETRGRAEQPAEEHEHEHQRNAGDDVRIHHGDVGRRVERGAQIFVAHPVHAHGGSRAHRGRHERCDHGEDERVFERVERFPVAEQLLIPF